MSSSGEPKKHGQGTTGESSSQYMYRIHPSREEAFVSGFTDSESSFISAHFSYLQTLTKSGVVQLAGKTPNEPNRGFGIVIFRAASESEARKIMSEDPAVSHGVFKAELFPFRTSLFNGEGWE